MGRLSSFFLVVQIFIAAATSTTCYNPDGSVTDFGQPAFQPCNQVVGQVSMCCGTNWTGGVVAKDICQPNGLCLNSYNDEPLYWRSSCTDPTWKSPLCLKNLCTTYTSGGDPTENVAVTQCDDGSWCCQGQNTTCCDAGLGLKIAATVGAAVSSTSSTTSKTSATSASSSSSSFLSAHSPSSTASSTSSTTTGPASSSSTATNTPLPNTATQDSKGSSGLSTGATAGISIAATVAVLASLALGFMLWRHRRKPYDMPLPYTQSQYGEVPKYHGPSPVEADSGERRPEMDSRERRPLHEMG